MANIEGIVQQLRQERDRLDAAIKALTAVGSSTTSNGSVRGRRGRRLSAAARQRIAAAQRARWAKIKAKQK
jgi:hypothetical protein